MKNKDSASLQNKTLTLRGAHGQCAACREYFNSTHAFDKHRVGRFTPTAAPKSGGMERRCLNPDEMRAKGMAVSSTGWWISRPQPAGKPTILRGQSDLAADISDTPYPSSPQAGRRSYNRAVAA